jgi:hypothetical protein
MPNYPPPIGHQKWDSQATDTIDACLFQEYVESPFLSSLQDTTIATRQTIVVIEVEMRGDVGPDPNHLRMVSKCSML